MDPWLWVIVPGFSAVVGGMLAYFVMQSRLDVALAKEREMLAQARGTIDAQKEALEQAVKAAEETAKRHALDEFMADMRVEERHYIREHRVLFLTRKSLVVQERIFFRNIPLSNWIEHEMMIEEGSDIDKVAKTLSVFGSNELMGTPSGLRKLLR